MKYFIACMCCLIVSFFGSLKAGEACAHAHAKGSIIITESEVIVDVSIPAEASGVGGDKPTLKEAERVDQILKSIQRPQLMSFYEDDGWFRAKKKLTPMIQKKSVKLTHGEHHEDDEHHDHAHENNAEIQIKYHYTYKKGNVIDYIDTDLFTRVPNIHKLDLIIIREEDQTQHILTPHKSRITL